MAGTSLLTLIDDIATHLDDIAAMTKIAAKKTSGVLGDDLALNAEQVTGVASERELPVVWSVAQGSFVNKLILIPLALLISQFIPGLITPLLMLGGAFLCYEGFDKVYEKLLHRKDVGSLPLHLEEKTISLDSLSLLEKTKINGAIKTDFVLSAEIIVITLGTVADENIYRQAAVLFGIGLFMTVGVYGLVALIVKLDDIGFYLLKKKNSGVLVQLGQGLVHSVPYLMKTLGVVGTLAMFLVGGGIISHGIPWVHHWTEHLHWCLSTLTHLLLGLLTGACLVFIHHLWKKKLSHK